MKHFDYFAPTEIIFGAGRVTEAGALAARYGKKAMLVTVPEFPAVAELYAKVSFRISVKNGVVQVDHKVYIESCPSTPIAWPSFSFLVHCLGSSSNLASLTTSVDTKFPSLFLPQRVAGQARITLAWVPVALAFI